MNNNNYCSNNNDDSQQQKSCRHQHDQSARNDDPNRFQGIINKLQEKVEELQLKNDALERSIQQIQTNAQRQNKAVSIASTVEELKEIMTSYWYQKITNRKNNNAEVNSNYDTDNHHQEEFIDTQQQSTNIQYYNHTSINRNDIERYSRQILVNGVGVSGQEKLKNTSVLVIGAGGIGSTVLYYLAGAGIGCIGVADFDTVEICNLHRQIIHSTTTVGTNKAISACTRMIEFNPLMQCIAIPFMISTNNCISVIEKFDIIVDASDNPMTRYIINDACVLCNKVLISGSAIGTDGQMTVYNYSQPTSINITTGSATTANATTISSNNEKTNCYRCLYPKPNLQANCQSCSDSGVLGPVPGLIGILQAMEVIKIIVATAPNHYENPSNVTSNTANNFGTVASDRMILYDSLHSSFTSIKKPQYGNPNCPACGINPTILSADDTYNNLVNCRGPSQQHPQQPSGHNKQEQRQAASQVCTLPVGLDDTMNISGVHYKEKVYDNNTPHVLVDVRVPIQYEMFALPNSINIPLNEIQHRCTEIENLVTTSTVTTTTLPIYCICRRGIASVQAVILLKHKYPHFPIYNIQGGYTAWQQSVDPYCPKY